MKTPEEIKKGLEHCHACRPCIDQCPYGDIRDTKYSCETELLADAIDYIRQLEDHIRDLKKMVPKWVNVEERLPQDNTDVLVHAIGNNENSVVAMTNYTHNLHGYNIEGWRSPWQYFFHEYKITHWMPLPEPPKEEEHK